MTTPTILHSCAEARGYLRGALDKIDISDSALPWYLRHKYGVILDANATVVSAPAPARADSAVARVQYREDIAPAAPLRVRDRRADAWAASHGLPLAPDPQATTAAPKFRDRRADAWNASHGLPLAGSPAQPLPGAKHVDRRAAAFAASHKGR